MISLATSKRYQSSMAQGLHKMLGMTQCIERDADRLLHHLAARTLVQVQRHGREPSRLHGSRSMLALQRRPFSDPHALADADTPG